jgi:ABC-2 type transport system ATP-binding protein
VEEGEVFGLLGPNGAGKTTTIEILEGYRPRDAGDVTVLGIDPHSGGRKLRERVGLVLQEAAVPPMLSVTELVDLYRGYYPAPRPAAEIIELVGLTEKAGERVRKLSGGQQRRLDVALGLVGDPELIFLDEPTTRNMRTLGKTIVLTTHYMDEAQYLADRICVIAAGQVVAQGTPESLRAGTEQLTHIRFELPSGVDAAALPLTVRLDDGTAIIETRTPTRTLNDLTTWAVAQGLELPNLEVARPSLEDVYLELTKHE